MEKVYELQSDDNVFDDIQDMIETMLKRLKGTPRTIAHIKAYIQFEGGNLKIGITSLNENTWREQLDANIAHSAKVIINARIHSDETIEDIFV